MARLDEMRLMTRVARLYYEHGASQREIAQQMDLSQATISRLLKRAESEEIVRITVSVPQKCYPDLEEALERRYGLKAAIVADCVADDEEQVLRDLGGAAAFYVESTVRPNDVVGISSWSATLLSMVNAMRPLPGSRSARVVQILGGVGDPAAAQHAAYLTGRLATLISAEAIALPAPGVVGSSQARRIVEDDPFVRATLATFDQVSLALVGIGSINPSRLLAASGNTFSPQELHELQAQGAVGDICLRFFDRAGQRVASPLDERVISMSLEKLRRVPRAVGIAGGSRKVEAIRGALRGRLINILITDHFTARRLVQEEDGGQ